MNNFVIEKLKKQIGQEIADSPSPMAIWLRGTLRKVEEGEIEADFTVRREMTNPYGTIHGGAIALIMDEIIGATVFTLNTKNAYVSVNLNVDFIKSAKKDEIITAKAKVIRKGSTIVNAECFLYNNKGRILARGTSNLVSTNIIKSFHNSKTL
jgi:acyl-coenzyme A thioesterase 13